MKMQSRHDGVLVIPSHQTLCTLFWMIHLIEIYSISLCIYVRTVSLNVFRSVRIDSSNQLSNNLLCNNLRRFPYVPNCLEFLHQLLIKCDVTLIDTFIEHIIQPFIVQAGESM